MNWRSLFITLSILIVVATLANIYLLIKYQMTTNLIEIPPIILGS